MNKGTQTFLLVLLATVWLSVGFAFLWSHPKRGSVVVVDCRLSEISPDFTTEMRELCRKARAQSLN